MQPTIESLYRSTCAAYSRVPNPDQCVAWEKVLSRYSVQEVAKAIAEWMADLTDDYDGQPKGRRFPTPADLAAICDKNARITSSGGEFVPCGACEGGWVRNFSGLTNGRKPVDRKLGAMRRCECWLGFLSNYYRIPRSELPAKVAELGEERKRRKFN